MNPGSDMCFFVFFSFLCDIFIPRSDRSGHIPVYLWFHIKEDSVKKIAVIGGDGTGPEVVAEGVEMSESGGGQGRIQI